MDTLTVNFNSDITRDPYPNTLSVLFLEEDLETSDWLDMEARAGLLESDEVDLDVQTLDLFGHELSVNHFIREAIVRGIGEVAKDRVGTPTRLVIDVFDLMMLALELSPKANKK